MPASRTAVLIPELFRAGNKSSPRLHLVRMPYDIVVFQKNGLDWAKAGSGGASCYESVQSGFSGTWWRLPAGTDYPASLLPVKDIVDLGDGHWSWEPAIDMPLADYIAALADLNAKFITV